MDFDSPDVEKDFPGLYVSESSKKNLSRDSDYSDEDKTSRKDILGKKRESKKDKGYAALEGESSNDDDETKSPGKRKKSKSTFKSKFSKKEKENKEKKEEKEVVCKKESKELKKEYKESKKEHKDTDKEKPKKKKERKFPKIRDKKKKSIDQGNSEEEKPIFGIPLSVAVERSKSYDGIEIPVIVRECIDYIEEHGLACESIYKITGLKSKVNQLKVQYNKREKVYLYEHEPRVVASLLKQYLRDLPEPILTSELTPKFEEAAAIKNEKKRIESLQRLLDLLPNCNRLLLSWIFVHMSHVVNLEKRNKMSVQNVLIVLNTTLHISHNLLQALFVNRNILFKGTELKKYVPPIDLDSSRLSLELPDSPTAIAEELSKQENILNILHDELKSGIRDQEKEEKLWEIQRVVTQLKRKLRFLKQVQDATHAAANGVQHVDTNPKKVEVCEQNFPAKSQTDMIVIPSNCAQIEIESAKNTDNSPVKVNDTENKSPEKSINVVENEISASTAQDTQDSETSSKITCPNISPLNQEEKNITLTEDVEIPKTAKEDSANAPEIPAPPLPPCHEEKPQSNEDDSELKMLIQEERMLQIQTEELMLLGDELKRKLYSEKMEIDRLKVEIQEYQQLYKYKRYSFGLTDNSSSESDDSSDSSDDEELSSVLEELMKENKFLEAKNEVLSKLIQQEREKCLSIKVQLKLLQQSDKMERDCHTRM